MPKVPTRDFRPRRAKSTLTGAKQAQKSKDTTYVNPNKTGMGALPVELLLLITSFLPGLPVPCRANEDFSVPENLYRSQALENLALTCRIVRATVLPLVWQSVEVIHPAEQDLNIGNVFMPESKPTPKAVDRALAIQLIRKLETITIREPQYAASVRTLSVILPKYSAKTVYAEFLRALTCLPNLSTVQILQVDYLTSYDALPTVVSTFIEKHGRIKSVRTFVLASGASSFLSAFENLNRVIFLPGSNQSPSYALFVMAKHAPMVEELELVWMRGNHGLHADVPRAVAQNFPNLRNFPCMFPVTDDPNPPPSPVYNAVYGFNDGVCSHLDQMKSLRHLDFDGNSLTAEIVDASTSVKKAVQLLLEKKRKTETPGENAEIQEFSVRIWEGRRLFTKIVVK